MNILSKIQRKITDSRAIYISSQIVQYDKEFEGKRALIIGGGTGIGLSISQELKASGAEIVIASRKNYKLDDISSEVLDVDKLENLEENLNKIIDKYEHFDIVVNSQGILPYDDFKQNFYAINMDDFEKVIRVNLESVFFINQFFCRYFETHNIKGHVLNICSTEGVKGAVVPYGISKAGVISLTQGIGKKMASKGVTVNGIAPGATATEMMSMGANSDLRKNYIPSKRANLPVEIAKVAHILLSDVGKRMCGQVVTVDGGESLK